MASELSACLLACRSPDLATRQAAEQTLARGEAENFVGLAGGLAAELSGEDRPPNSRQLAGLLGLHLPPLLVYKALRHPARIFVRAR